MLNPRFLSNSASYDVLLQWQSLADVACHVIQRMSSPRLFSKLASYDVASNICQALRGGVHLPGGEDDGPRASRGRDNQMPAKRERDASACMRRRQASALDPVNTARHIIDTRLKPSYHEVMLEYYELVSHTC